MLTLYIRIDILKQIDTVSMKWSILHLRVTIETIGILFCCKWLIRITYMLTLYIRIDILKQIDTVSMKWSILHF